ncbi:MAG: translation initiation factor eIF-2B subunit [Patescibacteria group bacterium]|nr:translation initiation factor eIF-2B subunit [Patescibacteria group bacterium]
MDKIENKIKKIASIEIQGATKVALTFISIVLDLASKVKNKNKLIKEIKRIEKKILKHRPTEPLLANFSHLIIEALKNYKEEKSLYNYIKNLTDDIKNFYEDKKKKIIKNGSALIKNGENIFTHCHSSKVEGIIFEAKKKGKKFKLYHTETRPLFQGRITGRNLLKHKIDVNMVCDSAAPFLVSDHSGDDIKITKVFIGSDLIALNGDCVNKIGSFGIALTAWESKIPLYVAASLLKIDTASKNKISYPIEKRKASEVWSEAPKDLNIINYAFDFVPAKFITGYITEFGVIKPEQVKTTVKNNYQCLF